MIGASKILTVSYGTFSCTLEGFDEPFNTMKAIAEYFRDLAAEDRYFGAEPPTPDAAMLHRIAEREIQRRVEAKIQDNGVILRAGDPEPAVLAPPVLQPSVSSAEQTDATGESVAARLSRLRASQLTQTAVLPTTAFQDTYSEDQHADDILAGFTDFDASDAPAGLGGFNAQTDADLDTSALQDLIAEDTAAPIFDAVDEVDASDADEAPMTANTPAEDFLPEYVADADIAFGAEYDDEFDTGANTEFNDETMLASVSTLIAENDHVAPSAADAAAEADDVYEDIDLSETEAPLAADPGFEDDEDAADAMLQRFADAASADVPGTLIDDDTAYSTLEAISAPLLDDADDTDALAEPEAEAVAERQPRARARVIKIRRADVAAQAEPAAATSLLSPEAEAALQAELAELEAENAIPEVTAPETAPEIAVAEDPAPVAPSPRPMRPVRQIAVRAPSAEVAPDPEQDLALEAAVSAVLIPEDVAVLPQAVDLVAEDASHDPSQGRKLLDASTQDDDVSRLMAQTNSEMDDGENRRRHNAIAHLKAAVAATEAERQIAATNPGKVTPDRQDAYRNDLQSVVRQQPADPRPALADRPSPLVLVSEQRIDRKPNPSATVPVLATSTDPATPRVIMPVRPRRMQQTPTNAQDTLLGNDEDDLEDDIVGADEDVNLFVEGNSFADFAEKLGATTLPELLEASAVYCAQVLGRPQFSRPLVLRQLDTLIGAPDHSREDGLRVFGTLLRQGRIAKVKRGQFAVTDRSPILAEALRNAG